MTTWSTTNAAESTVAATSAAVTPPAAEPTSMTRAPASPATAGSMARTTCEAYVAWSPPTSRSRRPAPTVGSGEVGDVAARGDPLHRHAASGGGQGEHQVRDAARGVADGGVLLGPRGRVGVEETAGDVAQRRARIGGQRVDPDRAQATATGLPARLAGEEPGRQDRAHLQAVEQPAAAGGDVLEELGVALRRAG